MEPELIKEKFHNLEKWQEKIDTIVWQNKSKLERIMDSIDKLEKTIEKQDKKRWQIYLWGLGVIATPIILYVIERL